METIKPNELRIGNKLLDPNGYEIEVTELSLDSVGTDDSIFNCKDVKGIALNSDQIYRLGFKLHVESTVCREYWIGHNPLTHDYLFMIVEMKQNPRLPPPDPDEIEIFYRNGFFRLRYVHQLMNLFHALTGQELTQI